MSGLQNLDWPADIRSIEVSYGELLTATPEACDEASLAGVRDLLQRVDDRIGLDLVFVRRDQPGPTAGGADGDPIETLHGTCVCRRRSAGGGPQQVHHAVQVTDAAGTPLGTLCCMLPVARTPAAREHDAQVLGSVVRLTASALANARLGPAATAQRR